MLGVSFLNCKGKAMFGGGLVTRVTSSFDGPLMFAFTHAHACIPSWGSMSRLKKSTGKPLLGLMKSAASKLTCPLLSVFFTMKGEFSFTILTVTPCKGLSHRHTGLCLSLSEMLRSRELQGQWQEGAL